MTRAAKLFVIGLSVHIVYVLALYFTESKLTLFWEDDPAQLTNDLGEFTPDAPSYISSADNFAAYGVFGSGQMPDHHRTIGYPFILYLFKLIFGQSWYRAIIVFQTIIAAFIYPMIYHIGKIILRQEPSYLFWVVMSTILCGTYFTRTVLILTDLTCAVFFFAGLLAGMTAVVRKGNMVLFIVSLICLSVAGVIRPVLSLYPLAFFFMLLYIAGKYAVIKEKHVLLKIISITVLLFFTCNYSALRVWYYYLVFSSTDVLSVNMMYTAKASLTGAGRATDYTNQELKIEAIGDWKKQCELRKALFVQTIRSHPFHAMKYWTETGLSHLLSPHYMETGAIYGYYKRTTGNSGTQLKQSPVLKGMFYILSGIQLIFVLIPFCLLMMVRLLRDKDYLYVLTMLMMILTLLAPTFIAAAGPRMRMTVEPFLILGAFQYIASIISSPRKISFQSS